MAMIAILIGCVVLATVMAALATWGFWADQRDAERRLRSLAATDRTSRRPRW